MNLCKCGCGGEVNVGRNFLPSHSIRSPEHKAALLAVNEGGHKSEEARQKMSDAKRDIPKSEAHKESLSKAGKAYYAKPGSKEARAKKQKDLWADPEYRLKQSSKHKNKVQSKETKVKRSKSLAARWADPAFKEKQQQAHKRYFDSPESKPKLQKAGTASMRVLATRKRPSKPEREARVIIDTMNLVYVFQYELLIAGKQYFVDFYFPVYNLCLEIDGRKWHGDEALKPEMPINDAIREKHILGKGYELLRVWDDELHLLETKLINKIKELSNVQKSVTV